MCFHFVALTTNFIFKSLERNCRFLSLIIPVKHGHCLIYVYCYFRIFVIGNCIINWWLKITWIKIYWLHCMFNNSMGFDTPPPRVVSQRLSIPRPLKKQYSVQNTVIHTCQICVHFCFRSIQIVIRIIKLAIHYCRNVLEKDILWLRNLICI